MEEQLTAQAEEHLLILSGSKGEHDELYAMIVREKEMLSHKVVILERQTTELISERVTLIQKQVSIDQARIQPSIGMLIMCVVI